ncbi:MAG: hypothetical protein Q8P67_05290 [archaeon]|nr:hypothetical protein [archaeon]
MGEGGFPESKCTANGALLVPLLLVIAGFAMVVVVAVVVDAIPGRGVAGVFVSGITIEMLLTGRFRAGTSRLPAGVSF